MFIKFVNDEMREYSNGNEHFWNTGNPIEVTSLQAMDLLEARTGFGPDSDPIFEEVPAPVEEIPIHLPGSINEKGGVVTPGSVPESRSDIVKTPDISDDSVNNGEKVSEVPKSSDSEDQEKSGSKVSKKG